MAFQNQDYRKRRTAISRQKLTFTSGEDVTSIDVTLRLNGKILQYTLVAPDLDTDSTYDLEVYNEDDVLIYTNTGIADNSTVTTLVSDKPIPLSGTYKYTISYTTTQQPTIDMYVYYE